MINETPVRLSVDNTLTTVHRCLHRLEDKAKFNRAELLINCPGCGSWFEARDWDRAWEGLGIGRRAMDRLPARSRSMLQALTMLMGDLTALLNGSERSDGLATDHALDEEVVFIRLEHYYRTAWAAADRDDRAMSPQNELDRGRRLRKVARAWEEDLLNRGLMEVLAWAGISLSPRLRDSLKEGRLDRIAARSGLSQAELDWLKLLPGVLAQSRYELHGLIQSRLQSAGRGGLKQAKPTVGQAAAIIKSKFASPPEDEPMPPPREERDLPDPPRSEEETAEEEPVSAKDNLRSAVGVYLTERMTDQVKREVDQVDRVLAGRLSQPENEPENNSELSQYIDELLAGFKKWEIRAMIEGWDGGWFGYEDIIELLKRYGLDESGFKRLLRSAAGDGAYQGEQRRFVDRLIQMIDSNTDKHRIR